MSFANPLLLIGLTAILIPIIIHLFNFRRYKTVYFSNVKLLQDIMQKTRRESQIQHLIVLLLRILGIAALVFAFAQPYIPNSSHPDKKGNLISIFVDNSFSMEANSKDGSLINDAADIAKKIVNAFSYNDDFVLVTQDFSAKQSHILSKDEIITLLDEIEVSSSSKDFKEIIAFEKNSCSNSNKGNILHYYISDFQKSEFDLSPLSHTDSSKTYLLPIPATNTNNVSIDSCWFLTPVFKIGQQVTLTVRVHNYGSSDIMKLPLKLHVNKEQKAIAALDLKANSFADYQMNYTITSAGIQCGELSIEDDPITFDDQLFFVYEVYNSTNIIAIQENNSNKYIRALYGKDSLFHYTEMNVHQINYSLFKESQLIILDQIKSVSSGLSAEIKKFVSNGGNLLIFPNKETDLQSWSAFLSDMGLPNYQKLEQKELKLGKINKESHYYNGALHQGNENIEMPTIFGFLPISKTSEKTNSQEIIMQLENGETLLSAFRVEKGKVFISTVALNDDFGNAHKHALFFVPLHNIAIMSILQSKLYNIIGKEEMQSLYGIYDIKEEVLNMISQDQNTEFIPEYRKIGSETILFFHSQIHQAGFYDLKSAHLKLTSLAFNFNRMESNLSYYNEKELKTFADENSHIEVLDSQNENLTKNITDKIEGRSLWQYFILLALLCFLVEIVAIRCWKKSKI